MLFPTASALFTSLLLLNPAQAISKITRTGKYLCERRQVSVIVGVAAGGTR
jgi:hypothetical protein